MIYIIMERKTWGDGDNPKEVFTSERKCKQRLAELYAETMKNYPDATQTMIENGICFDMDENFISYQMIIMEISR
jgi:hypothetical protein